jgi:hypothetical protein
MPGDNLDDFNYLKENTPFVIDTRYDLFYNLAINITKEDYEKTFISVVTESLADDDTLFFSEKIWKPIMVGHPFILYGNQHSLKLLKEWGFKTFNKWIDESYDDVLDRVQRAEMVVKELKKFENKSVDELTKIREEMEEICIFNQNHYRVYYNKKYNDDGTCNDLSNIYKEVWSKIKDKI